MKSYATLFLLICLLPSGLQAQPSVMAEYPLSGTLHRVNVYHIRAERARPVIVYGVNGVTLNGRLDKASFVPPPDGWTQVRLRNVSPLTYTAGWQLSERKKLRVQGQDMFRTMKAQGKVLDAPRLEAYLDELLLRIHPQPLATHLSEAEVHLHGAVITAPMTHKLALYDGTLLLPVEELTRFRSEKDLARWLSLYIAFLEADVPLSRIGGAYTPYGCFALVDEAPGKLDASLRTWVFPTFDSMAWADSASFTRRIAPALQHVASLEYSRRNYQAALGLCERMIRHEAAMAETFLLKAKIHRKLYTDPSATQAAFSYVVRAESLTELPRADILAEKSMLLVRLGKMHEAIAALTTYRDMMQREQNTKGISWAEDMIRYCRAEAEGGFPANAATLDPPE